LFEDEEESKVNFGRAISGLLYYPFPTFLVFLNEIYRKFSDSIIVARFLMEFDGKIKYDEIPPSFFSRKG
jgi:hypothetical protein